ncbi:hypothetical protein [Neomoorella glycerini]|uniref:hypothetical protein n=1 Tax=Neomoorella glycerini TaxID=55779 RepID=UPI0012E255FD|nr:hypothetical protein [Moorella glycerini]
MVLGSSVPATNGGRQPATTATSAGQFMPPCFHIKGLTEGERSGRPVGKESRPVIRAAAMVERWLAALGAGR